MSKSCMLVLFFSISFFSQLHAEEITVFSLIPWIDKTQNHQVYGITSDFTGSVSGTILAGRSSEPSFSAWAAGLFTFHPGPLKVRGGFLLPPTFVTDIPITIPIFSLLTAESSFPIGSVSIGLRLGGFFLPEITTEVEAQHIRVQGMSFPFASLSVGLSDFTASTLFAIGKTEADIERVSVGQAEVTFRALNLQWKTLGFYGAQLQGEMSLSAIAGLFGHTAFSVKSSAVLDLVASGLYWSLRHDFDRVSFDFQGTGGIFWTGSTSFALKTEDSSGISSWFAQLPSSPDWYVLAGVALEFRPSQSFFITPFRLIAKSPSFPYLYSGELDFDVQEERRKDFFESLKEIHPLTLLFAGAGIVFEFKW